MIESKKEMLTNQSFISSFFFGASNNIPMRKSKKRYKVNKSIYSSSLSGINYMLPNMKSNKRDLNQIMNL
jgi:uncharacterized membrane protein